MGSESPDLPPLLAWEHQLIQRSGVLSDKVQNGLLTIQQSMDVRKDGTVVRRNNLSMIPEQGGVLQRLVSHKEVKAAMLRVWSALVGEGEKDSRCSFLLWSVFVEALLEQSRPCLLDGDKQTNSGGAEGVSKEEQNPLWVKRKLLRQLGQVDPKKEKRLVEAEKKMLRKWDRACPHVIATVSWYGAHLHDELNDHDGRGTFLSSAEHHTTNSMKFPVFFRALLSIVDAWTITNEAESYVKTMHHLEKLAHGVREDVELFHASPRSMSSHSTLLSQTSEVVQEQDEMSAEVESSQDPGEDDISQAMMIQRKSVTSNSTESEKSMALTSSPQAVRPSPSRPPKAKARPSQYMDDEARAEQSPASSAGRGLGALETKPQGSSSDFELDPMFTALLLDASEAGVKEPVVEQRRESLDVANRIINSPSMAVLRRFDSANKSSLARVDSFASFASSSLSQTLQGAIAQSSELSSFVQELQRKYRNDSRSLWESGIVKHLRFRGSWIAAEIYQACGWDQDTYYAIGTKMGFKALWMGRKPAECRRREGILKARERLVSGDEDLQFILAPALLGGEDGDEGDDHKEGEDAAVELLRQMGGESGEDGEDCGDEASPEAARNEIESDQVDAAANALQFPSIKVTIERSMSSASTRKGRESALGSPSPLARSMSGAEYISSMIDDDSDTPNVVKADRLNLKSIEADDNGSTMSSSRSRFSSNSYNQRYEEWKRLKELGDRLAQRLSREEKRSVEKQKKSRVRYQLEEPQLSDTSEEAERIQGRKLDASVVNNWRESLRQGKWEKVLEDRIRELETGSKLVYPKRYDENWHPRAKKIKRRKSKKRPKKKLLPSQSSDDSNSDSSSTYEATSNVLEGVSSDSESSDGEKQRSVGTNKGYRLESRCRGRVSAKGTKEILKWKKELEEAKEKKSAETELKKARSEARREREAAREKLGLYSRSASAQGVTDSNDPLNMPTRAATAGSQQTIDAVINALPMENTIAAKQQAHRLLTASVQVAPSIRRGGGGSLRTPSIGDERKRRHIPPPMEWFEPVVNKDALVPTEVSHLTAAEESQLPKVTSDKGLPEVMTGSRAPERQRKADCRRMPSEAVKTYGRVKVAQGSKTNTPVTVPRGDESGQQQQRKAKEDGQRQLIDKVPSDNIVYQHTDDLRSWDTSSPPRFVPTPTVEISKRVTGHQSSLHQSKATLLNQNATENEVRRATVTSIKYHGTALAASLSQPVVENKQEGTHVPVVENKQEGTHVPVVENKQEGTLVKDDDAAPSDESGKGKDKKNEEGIAKKAVRPSTRDRISRKTSVIKQDRMTERRPYRPPVMFGFNPPDFRDRCCVEKTVQSRLRYAFQESFASGTSWDRLERMGSAPITKVAKAAIDRSQLGNDILREGFGEEANVDDVRKLVVGAVEVHELARAKRQDGAQPIGKPSILGPVPPSPEAIQVATNQLSPSPFSTNRLPLSPFSTGSDNNSGGKLSSLKTPTNWLQYAASRPLR